MELDVKLVGFDGTPIKDSNKEELTVRGVICSALISNDQREEIAGMEKFKRYNLAMKIYNKEIEKFTAEEIVLIKELVGKYFTTMIVGQVYNVLESI